LLIRDGWWHGCLVTRGWGIVTSCEEILRNAWTAKKVSEQQWFQPWRWVPWGPCDWKRISYLYLTQWIKTIHFLDVVKLACRTFVCGKQAKWMSFKQNTSHPTLYGWSCCEQWLVASKSLVAVGADNLFVKQRRAVIMLNYKTLGCYLFRQEMRKQRKRHLTTDCDISGSWKKRGVVFAQPHFALRRFILRVGAVASQRLLSVSFPAPAKTAKRFTTAMTPVFCKTAPFFRSGQLRCKNYHRFFSPFLDQHEDYAEE